MEIIKYPDKNSWNKLLKRHEIDRSKLESTVKYILNDIRKSGDKAVLNYTSKFDKVKLNSLLVSEAEVEEAKKTIDGSLKKAIDLAKNNIERFHIAQIMPSKIIETMPGVKCWQKSTPIEKVGLYVPGGSAPLFSTVLMLGIPAIIAGCSEIVLCSPPGKDGKLAPSIIYTADLIGIKKIFKIGGVQAIGAMAFGTESVPRVYKIFGPGNQFVMTAKQIVNTLGVAIDMPAGPSEVAIIADKTSDPVFVAAELLAQAEHGKDSQVLLFTTNENVITGIEKELDIQLSELPRKELATTALQNSMIIILKSDEELMEIINNYAPEHLAILVDNPERYEKAVINAGSVFLGQYTPVSAGDYASGTNHTLPTNSFAKTYSGVNLDSFIKKITFQQISREGIRNIGHTIKTWLFQRIYLRTRIQ